MTTIAYSPTPSSFIMSYRPTSPLSRPGSPLSQNTYSRSTSPYPSHTHKSKSISAIPTSHSIHRLSNSNSSSFPYQLDENQAGPSNLTYRHHINKSENGNTLSRSSSFKHRPKTSSIISSNDHNGSLTLSRASSVRSSKSNPRSSSKAVSPSRLPSTNSVSYFPPFEVMGSSEDDISTSENASGVVRNGESSTSASPSLSPSKTRKQRHPRQTHHVKGKSLSSIAGMVSASLSWSLSSLSCTTSPSLDPNHPSHIDNIYIEGVSKNDNDDKVVEALTRRFTNSFNGKRRVLEPFTLSPLDLDNQEKQIIGNAQEGERGTMHKRRMRSEVEVDMVLSRSSSLGGRMIRGSGFRGGKKNEEKIMGDEDVVEDLLVPTPSRSQTSTRRIRPNLRLPIPTLPNWRFPLGPSPPVTCLSPDIPLEAFSTAIENPCLLTPSRIPSPLKSIEDEVEAIDVGLSPSPSPTSPCSFNVGPSTPPKDHEIKEDDISIKRLTPSSYRHWIAEKNDLDLRRVGSRTSEMSCETIKQHNGGGNGDWLEVTPRPSKIVKRVEVSLPVI